MCEQKKFSSFLVIVALVALVGNRRLYVLVLSVVVAALIDLLSPNDMIFGRIAWQNRFCPHAAGTRSRPYPF